VVPSVLFGNDLMSSSPFESLRILANASTTRTLTGWSAESGKPNFHENGAASAAVRTAAAGAATPPAARKRRRDAGQFDEGGMRRRFASARKASGMPSRSARRCEKDAGKLRPGLG